jgi:hypothetical protein
MSKLETNTIDTISGSTTLTLGGTNATDVTFGAGVKITNLVSTGIDDNATSTAITIDSSQNVGIGTVSPAELLNIVGSGGNAKIRLDGDLSGGLQNNFIGCLAYDDLTIASDESNTGTASTIQFRVDAAERMRIDSSGNVGIGTTGPDAPLDIRATNSSIRLGNASQFFRIQHNDAANALVFNDNDLAERIRIDSQGSVLVNNNATPHSQNTVGAFKVYGTGSGAGVVGLVSVARFQDPPLLVNRVGNDGNLVEFFGQGSVEGSISVSGGTVAYNGFTGTHWSRFIDESKPDVLRGTVLESLDQMTDWYNVEFTDNENNLQKKPYALKANEQEGDVITYAWEKKDEEGNDIIEQVQATIVKQVDVKHVMSKISDTVEAKNVYGVFSAWDNDDLINNDFYVASVGSYVVRIKAGQVVAKGDLLQSNGDGTAKVQTDDAIRASTFAKVLSTAVIETYEDGSYLVPCSLMC